MAAAWDQQYKILLLFVVVVFLLPLIFPHPRPLFHLFSVFLNKQYKFYSKLMRKMSIQYPGIQTHDLLIMSLLLDQGSRPVYFLLNCLICVLIYYCALNDHSLLPFNLKWYSQRSESDVTRNLLAPCSIYWIRGSKRHFAMAQPTKKTINGVY